MPIPSIINHIEILLMVMFTSLISYIGWSSYNRYIDTNGKYGDFLVDLATLDWNLRKLDAIKEYQNYRQQIGISINFKERVIGANYYNAIDPLIGLRF
ncbi:hypothetical protein QUF84_17710 [Fictibacillus enclensis]|uniref:hypothetical protein n=1 Tax=Fictibacillus enclensis TaxID=1017270 RepID=UPI0025A0C1F1|nr:hypothetical protein [Fictibacillus enclensis]MDM5339049.1 hypothetical protein [Fictibacillus enclensis]